MSEFAEVIKVTLGGIDADGFAKQLSETLDTARRTVGRAPVVTLPSGREMVMEGGYEIEALWRGFRQRRSAAIDGIVSDRDRDATRLLRDLWLYMKDLDAVRSATPETYRSMLSFYGVYGRDWDPSDGAPEPFRGAIGETVAYADERLKELAGAVRALERGERAAARERRRQEWIALRPVVLRQLADALIAREGMGRDSTDVL